MTGRADKSGLIDVVTGNTGQATSLDVLLALQDGDRAIRKARVAFADYDLSKEYFSRTQALLDQIDPILDAMDRSNDADVIAKYQEQLADIYKQIESGRRAFEIESTVLRKREGATLLNVAADIMFVPVQMAIAALRNAVLLALFWIVTIGVVVAAAKIVM